MRPPTVNILSVGLGGLMRMEKSRAPSQVVATRKSVERARMYSSISGVILKDWDFSDIAEKCFHPLEIDFQETVLEADGFNIQSPA